MAAKSISSLSLAAGCLVVSLGWAFQARAGDYYFGGTPGTHAFVEFVDLSTLSTMPDGTRKVWIVTVYNMKKPHAHNAAYDKELSIFDCQNNTEKTEEAIFYREDGSVLSTVTANSYDTASNIVPESVGSQDLAVVCATPEALSDDSKFTHAGDVDILKYGRGFIAYVEAKSAPEKKLKHARRK
jgi:hypothetical protein